MVNFQVAEFPMSDEYITSFQRRVVKRMDCVINALQLVGVLDDVRADLMRIAVGDQGLGQKQVEGMFNLMYPQNTWRFYRYTNIESLSKITDTMKPGHVIFAGYKGDKDAMEVDDGVESGHVFLIGKTLDGEIVYLDPQISFICKLNEPKCLALIDEKKEYYVMQYA